MAKPPRAPISIESIDDAPTPIPIEGVRSEPKARAEKPTEWRKAATRKGRRGVAFYLPPAAFRQLGRLSVDLDRSIQSLMIEATDDLFWKHKLARVAGHTEGEDAA